MNGLIMSLPLEATIRIPINQISSSNVTSVYFCTTQMKNDFFCESDHQKLTKKIYIYIYIYINKVLVLGSSW